MKNHKQIDLLRSQRSEVENHYIDELLGGSVDRSSSCAAARPSAWAATLMGSVLAAAATSARLPAATGATAAVKPKVGGTLRVGQLAPGAQINPLTTSDTATS